MYVYQKIDQLTSTLCSIDGNSISVGRMIIGASFYPYDSTGSKLLIEAAD